MKAKSKNRISFLTATCIAALSVTNVAPANAEVIAIKERINFAGKLRMLSQRTAQAACNLHAGVAVDASEKAISGAKVEFDKIVKGLRVGDSDLGIIGAEEDAKVIASLDALEGEWAPYGAALLNVVQDPGSKDNIEFLKENNLPLLEDAKQLVKDLVAEHADRIEAGSNIGKLIDVSGRQRMLTQKMSKEACMIWSGFNAAENIEALKKTMALFETSLIALRDGNEEQRMPKPPSIEIQNANAAIFVEWETNIRPMLEKAVAGEAVSMEERTQLVQNLNKALRDSNAVVGLYSTYENEQRVVGDAGATERVNFSGKLRMLSQRTAALSCNYRAGIGDEKTLSALIAAQTEFKKIITALEFGDPDLRIKGAEKRRKILHAIAEVHTEWDPISNAIDDLVQGKDTEAAMAVIDNGNMKLLGKTKLLVSEVSGVYSDPVAMLQSDAFLIDISGRQRMLTQKMSKEACLVWSGMHASETSEDLSGTMQLFDATLIALRDGYDGLGIKPAPTEEIKLGLEEIVADWSELKPLLAIAAEAQGAEQDKRTVALADLNTTLKKMNSVVGLYTVYAKTGL